MHKNEWSSLFFQLEEKTKEFRKAKEEFSKLPREASDTSIKPASLKAQEESTKARELRAKMDSIATDAGKIAEQFNRCHPNPYVDEDRRVDFFPC